MNVVPQERERAAQVSDVTDLVARLRAKAWQSTRYGNGRSNKPHNHVCWEAASALEQQARRIETLEGVLRRLFNLQPTQESSCNPVYWTAVQEARAALEEAK